MADDRKTNETSLTAQSSQQLSTRASLVGRGLQDINQNLDAPRLLYHDALTGVYNGVYFGMRIAEEIERASHFTGCVSLISADIDFFKSLNDEFGPSQGDEILRSVSAILKQGVRKMDAVCRYSDDDFMIIVPETNEHKALRVAEKLRWGIESHDFRGIHRSVTISCGVAEYPAHGATRDELVCAADSALILAKSSGRNQVAAAPDKFEQAKNT
jgi:diguanylate cyclase (GGDEF)-like protein